MKPKEYLKEFELSEDKFNNRQFVSKIRNQLYEDFIDLITKTRVTPNTFKNITKQLMDKVNILMNLSDLSDEQKRKKFSGYIYASVIIKERNKLYPNWSEACLKHKLETDKDFKRRYEHYLLFKQEDEYYEYYYKERIDRTREFFKTLNDNLNSFETKYFENLVKIGFIEGDIIDESTINRYYRINSKKYHPDANTSYSDPVIFNKLTECKEFLLTNLDNYSDKNNEMVYRFDISKISVF